MIFYEGLGRKKSEQSQEDYALVLFGEIDLNHIHCKNRKRIVKVGSIN